MQLFEFQAKHVFDEYGIPIPKGYICTNVEDAAQIYDKIKGEVAVKGQILSGGRGLAGGVRFARSPDEAREVAKQVLKLSIRGETPLALLMEEKVQHVKELYTAITWDYPKKCPTLIASSRGGMEIEKVAKEHPTDVARIHVDSFDGFSAYQARDLAVRIGLVGSEVVQYEKVFSALWKVFSEHDAELAEINPLAVLQDGTECALDAKLNIDDKSVQRQSEFVRKLAPVPPATIDQLYRRRAEAKELGIPTYIEMQGSLGVIADGAGSGMLTLDLVSDLNGKTRVYCEMGGEITPDLMEKTLMTASRVEGVKAVLVNLIGGLNRMDEMAIGISNYVTKHPGQVPIVVRMSGTKQDEGRETLTKNGIGYCDSLHDAIEKAVNFSKGH